MQDFFERGKKRITGKFLKVNNFSELVGYYGALVYCNEKGHPVKFRKFPFVLPEGETWTQERLFDFFGHEIGYKRAQEAFRRHGDRLLPRLARMDVEGAIRAAPRLLPVGLYEKRVLPVLDRLRGIKVD